MTNDVAIRPARPADVPYLLDLGMRTVETSVSGVREKVAESVLSSSLSNLMRIVLHSPHRSFLAEYGGEPVGFCLLLEAIPDEVTQLDQGFIAYMAVEPGMRRRGIGSRLLQAAEDATRTLGYRYVALMVTEENSAARRLYAHAGYATERRYLCKILSPKTSE